MRKSRMLVGAAIVAMLTLSGASPAMAEQPESPNCFGQGAVELAQSEDGMGAHASSFDTPRMGIGNVARAFGFDHPSELAEALGASC